MTELLCVVLTLAAVALDTAEIPPTANEDVLVRRAHLPVMIERARIPGSCAPEELDPSGVELRADGVRLRVTAIAPKPQPRTHALLLDTSESMSRRLEATKQVAMDYIDRLPEDDAILLASFDETLVLRGPLGMNRAAIKRHVASLRVGYSTGMWDALHGLALYLDTVRGEKVVILLSDGEDSSSIDFNGKRTRALLHRLPDLVVFPIGIALSSSAEARPAIARGQLAGLARLTGGRFLETQSAEGLPRTFREIRKRLEKRVFLSYVPEGEPTSEQLRAQRIRVAMGKDSPCRLHVLGPPQLEGRRRNTLPDHLERPSWVDTLDAGGMLVGQVNDLMLERGPLFTPRSIREGKPRISLDRVPEFAVREFKMFTPPLGEVLDALYTPERLLLYLLERAPDSTGRMADGMPARPAWMVHGQTLIRIRTAISRALFDDYVGYRDRTQAGIELATDHRLEHMLRTIPDIRALSPAGLSYLRQALRHQEADPELGAVPALLTEWLGDLRARDVVLGLEQMTANALLGWSDEPLDRDPLALVDLVLGSWDRLHEWFPPAVHARVLVPLLPAYSPERDVIGFYRILLPRPHPNFPRIDSVPARPLALRTALWLGRRHLLEQLGDRTPRVLALDYRNVRLLELEPKDCPPPASDRKPTRPTSKVRIVIGSASDQPDLTLVAYFHEGGTEPSCVSVGEVATASPEARAAATSLRQALADQRRLFDTESLTW